MLLSLQECLVDVASESLIHPGVAQREAWLTCPTSHHPSAPNSAVDACSEYPSSFPPSHARRLLDLNLAISQNSVSGLSSNGQASLGGYTGSAATANNAATTGGSGGTITNGGPGAAISAQGAQFAALNVLAGGPTTSVQNQAAASGVSAQEGGGSVKECCGQNSLLILLQIATQSTLASAGQTGTTFTGPTLSATNSEQLGHGFEIMPLHFHP